MSCVYTTGAMSCHKPTYMLNRVAAIPVWDWEVLVIIAKAYLQIFSIVFGTQHGHFTFPLQSTQMRMAEGWMLKCTPVHGWRLDCQWAKNQLFLRKPLHLTFLHESHCIVSACACPCELWSVVVVIVPTLLGLGHSLHCGFHGFQKPLIVRDRLAPHPVMFHVSIKRTWFPDHIVIAFIFQVLIETNHLVHTQAPCGCINLKQR